MDPQAHGRWMRETERRLRTLENTPRMANLTVAAGGLQSVTAPGFRYVAGVFSNDSPSNSLQAIRFQTGPTGRVLVGLGALVEVGGADADNAVALGLAVNFEGGPDLVTATGPGTVGLSTMQVVEMDPDRGTLVDLTVRLTFPTELANCHVIDPYLTVIPL